MNLIIKIGSGENLGFRTLTKTWIRYGYISNDGDLECGIIMSEQSRAKEDDKELRSNEDHSNRDVEKCPMIGEGRIEYRKIKEKRIN